jgi:hypothetical protein
MSVQHDKEEKVAGQDEDQHQSQGRDQNQEQDQGQSQSQGQDEGQSQSQDEQGQDQDQKNQQATEKPEPNEEHKQKAADMMTAYEDRPTLVLPGSGGIVSGTAVNDWLDEDGNPKYEGDGDAGSDQGARSDKNAGSADSGEDGESNEKDMQQQIEEDKALNEELRKAAKAENKGEKG